MRKTSILVLVPLVVLALIILSACGKMPGNPQAAESSDSNAAANNTTADTSTSGLPFGKATERKGEGSKLIPQDPITIPSGTPVTVRLQSSVSSATASAGDRFDAVLDAPIVINGRTVAQSGAPVVGRVVTARRSGRLQDPGVIQLALSSISVEGKQVAVSSSSVIARGASHKKRNWAMIGGGAGGGALIGGLMGGGKGALIGSAVGAGAGTGTAYATGKKDVGFGAERRLTFRLTQPIVLK